MRFFHCSKTLFEVGDVLLPLNVLRGLPLIPGNSLSYLDSVVYLSTIEVNTTIASRAWGEDWYCYEVEPVNPQKGMWDDEIVASSGIILACLGKVRDLQWK